MVSFCDEPLGSITSMNLFSHMCINYSRKMIYYIHFAPKMVAAWTSEMLISYHTTQKLEYTKQLIMLENVIEHNYFGPRMYTLLGLIILNRNMGDRNYFNHVPI
jgi:hypothetical protein